MRFLMQLIERHYLRRLFTYILICCLLFNVPASVVLAGPEGAEVIHGQVSLQQSGLNTVIHASDKSIINYKSFDIARPEVVQFIQPGSNASVLNRIISANPTFIDGTLLSNGRVFFVNPAGVIIGNGATINVSQLVASGLNISNDSFINGQYEFIGGGGSVSNYGDISAKSVYLVGKQVTNIGNINCPAGYVVMAAGDRVFLGHPGSSVIVEIGSLEPPANTQTPGDIINEGTVEAAGGKIILAAAGDALSRPIMANMGTLSTANANGDAGDISFQAGDGQLDNTGIITATSNSVTGGTITAVAGELINTGTIDVSGTQGGAVTLEATDRLGQFGTVNADGIDGDGGKISLTAGSVVALSSESVTTTNAGANGDGGDVIVYSPDTALFREGALIEAKGGSVSGDGGFVEVSGIEHVEVFGSVVTSAANGKSGQFLIDPRNITINNSGNENGGLTGPAGEWEPSSNDSELDIDSLEEYLDNQSVTISTYGGGESDGRDNQDGWIHFDAARDLYDGTDHREGYGSDYSLTVIADDYILLDSGIHFNGSGNVTLDGDRDITVNSEITLNSGLFTAHAGNSFESGILSINQDITVGSMILTAGNQSGYDTTGSRVYVGYTPVSDERNNAGEGIFDTTVDLVTTNVATGDITVESVHDVFIGGKVLAEGDIASLIGDVEGSAGFPEYGGDVITKSDVTAGGGIEFIGNAIDIDGHVRANGGNLVIEGRSSSDSSGGTVLNGSDEWGDIDVAANKTLFASGDISIIDFQNGSSGQMLLTGHNSLTIDSSGGLIDASDVVISVLGSSLALKQDGYLNLADYNFDYQNTTHLLLESYSESINAVDQSHGGKNANAADQWASITATAKNNITLQGAGTITAKALNSTATDSIIGNISVTSDSSKVLATEDITADNGSVSLIAANGIDVTANIIASSGITLIGLVHADGGSQVFDAGAGSLLAQDTITKASTGNLTLAGDALVDLEGKVQVDDGDLLINDTVNAESDLQASGLIWLQEIGNLAGNVTATGSDITFDKAVIADGLISQIFDAGSGTLWAKDTITKTGTGSLTLSGVTKVNLDNTVDVQSPARDLVVTGPVEADGLLKATGNIDLKNTATLGGNVTAVGGNIDFRDTVVGTGNSAQTFSAGGGTLKAWNTVDNTVGDLTLAGTGITLDEDVSAVGLTFNCPVTATKSTAQKFDAGSGSLWAMDIITKSAGTDLTIKGALVDLDSAVDIQTGLLTVTGPANISNDITGIGVTFDNAIIVDGGSHQVFDAGAGTLLASSKITKTAGTNLTLMGALVDLDGAVDVQTGDLIITDIVNAEDNLEATGLIHLQGATNNLAGDVISSGAGITFDNAVSADGYAPQTFDAQGGDLLAGGAITKTDGGLTLGGTLVNLDGVDAGTGDSVKVTGGELTIEDVVDAEGNLVASGLVRLYGDTSTNYIAGNISGAGIRFSASPVNIELDGAGDQSIDADSGILDADGTITKTTSGSLTLGGDTDIDLEGTVDVQLGSLIIEDDFSAYADLLASQDITFEGSIVNGEMDGSGNQYIDAQAGTLRASGTITKTTTGDLTLGGATGINLDGTVDIQAGSLTLEDNTTVASGQILKASYDVILADGKTLTGTSSLTIEATNGEIKAAGTGSTISVSGSMLTLKQGADLDLANFTFNNQSNTKLAAQSYNGSFTADNTNAANAADQWQSITATAEDNIELYGSGNINIASAGLSSDSGGVQIVSTGGNIYTPGAGGKLDAPITGSSNGTTGVDLPGGGKAAIVIISKDTLKLGPGAEMTANGTYGYADDRPGIDFLNVIEGNKDPGNPIDVAVYLASNTGNINVSSPVTIAPGGAMIVDAYDTVEPFGTEFLNSLTTFDWLEVCSRITPNLNYAQDNDTLLYASDPGLYPGTGTYVLRGEDPDVGTGAWVLAEEEKPVIQRKPIETEVTSTVIPVTPDITDVGPVESTTISNDLQWLGEELGLCEGDQQGEDDNQCQEITQAYLAGAFLQASDMRPHQAAAQLRDLAELLHDTDGNRIAALGRVINEFVQPNLPPSPEQFASIGQAFTLHVNDGTHYAAAKQWLDALGEYTMLLISEIGWSSEDSVAFVMGKYGPTVTESGNISVIAFIQMHLEDFAG